MHATFIAIVVLLFCTSGNGAVQSLALSSAKSDVSFIATVNPSSIKIKGTSINGESVPTLDGNLVISQGKISGVAKYKLDLLDAGMELRTKHMKEKYLETEKFPVAEISLNETALPTETGKSSPFTGTLTLHGVSKKIEGEVRNSADEGAKTQLEFDFKVKISDFGIPIPSFLGLTVEDMVDLKVKVLGKPTPS